MSAFLGSLGGFGPSRPMRRYRCALAPHELRSPLRLEDRLTPASFIVTNLQDSGAGSLRQAIAGANGLAGADTISFEAGLTGTITLATELFVTGAVSIDGPGANVVTVSGNNLCRVFKLDAPGSKNAINISGLTIANGYGDTNGGGIRNKDEALTVTDCIVTGNVGFLDGGGIFVYSAEGSLVVRRCTITNNSAPYGGGIDIFQGGGGSLVVEDTVVSGNSAIGVPAFMIDGHGGGIYFHGTVGAAGLIIRNSTISGNTATGSGAGIGVANLTGNLVVQNCTITGNINTNGSGGGIARLFGTGAVILDSTIVSGNSSPTALDLFSAGTVTANQCAIGSKVGVTTFNADATTYALLGMDPLLGPLTTNGGLTMTHALMNGSPCIDAGSNLSNLAFDQRGAGFLRDDGTGPDIGAFEVQPPPGFTGEPVSINAGSPQRSIVNEVTIQFNQLVNLPSNPAAAFEMKRQSDNLPVGLVATVENTTSTRVKLTFTGPLTQGGSLVDGRYTLKLLEAMISNGNGFLDGNGDGIGGDDYVLASTGTSGIYRLFGDADGNGIVNAVDFQSFRLVFGTAGPSVFDVNNDGVVNYLDFFQFRDRFGDTLP